MKRRDFLLASAAAGFMLRTQPGGAVERHDGRTLILVELNGGNDGLNTLVPFTDPAYRRLRPRLALSRDAVLPLNQNLGLNRAMAPLIGTWRAGQMAVIAGVGYPRSNRSHFRSIEIWETASDSAEIRREGWISQAMREVGDTGDGVILGGGIGPLIGPGLTTVVMREAGQFIKRAQTMPVGGTATDNRALAHILEVREQVRAVAGRMSGRLANAAFVTQQLPRSPLGRQLGVAARLIIARVPLRVIKLQHRGYDTHAGQINKHDRLLTELAESLAAFRQLLLAANVWDQVLIMTYSEFGRRAAENAATGTDHGTAAPHFILGGRVKGGLYGSQPPLEDLKDGDLRHRVDFRQLYATVSERWLGLGAAPNTLGQHMPLDLVA